MSDIEFENYLKDGEQILWSHIPEKKKLHLSDGIIPIVLGAACVIAGLYVLLNERAYSALVFIIIGLIIISAGIERSAAYLLTDKRVLIFKGEKYKEIPYHHISFVTVDKKKNSDMGTVSLCFSYLRKRRTGHHTKEYKVRWRKLYDVQDCEKVADIIKAQKELPNAYDKAREAERRQGF